MCLSGLSVWAERERVGRLASETRKWRAKRHEAEDPDTTAGRLQQLTEAVTSAWRADLSASKQQSTEQGHLVIEAVAAHPNTAPHTLIELLSLDDTFNPIAHSPNRLWERLHLFYGFTTHYSRGLCRNPVAPLLCLETPDFWGGHAGVACCIFCGTPTCHKPSCSRSPGAKRRQSSPGFT